MMKGHWVNGYHFFFFFSFFQQNLRLWFTSDCAVSAVRDTFRCIQITTRAMAKSSSSSPFILHFFCVIFLQHKQMTSVSWPLISYTVHTLSPSASASASAQSPELIILIKCNFFPAISSGNLVAYSIRLIHVRKRLLQRLSIIIRRLSARIYYAAPKSPDFLLLFLFFLFIGSCMLPWSWHSLHTHVQLPVAE